MFLGAAIVRALDVGGRLSAKQCSLTVRGFQCLEAEFAQVAAAKGRQSGPRCLRSDKLHTGTISDRPTSRSFPLSLDEFMQRRGTDTIAQRGRRLKGQTRACSRIEQVLWTCAGPFAGVWGEETEFGGFLGAQHRLIQIVS